MSQGFTDWTDLGIFPLQDIEEGVPLGTRMQMVGGRVLRRPDPGDAGAASLTEYAREEGLGTLGDIHPWFFWQTAEREKRAMGSWSMAWGAIVTSAQDGYGVAGVKPLTVNESDMVNDVRYTTANPIWQFALPWQPEGMLSILMPSTDEEEPSSVMLNGDRRLVASNAKGPGEAGTTIVDMQPHGELCMDGSDTPGQGGRHARLQALLKVIPLGPGSLGGTGLGGADLNSIALNYGSSQQDGIAGYGMVFGPSVNSVPPVKQPSAPVTGGGGPGPPGGGSGSGGGSGNRNSGQGAPPPPGNPRNGDFGGSGGGNLNSSYSDEETTVADFGSFSAAARGGYAIGLMHEAASGPINFGCGKHEIGRDKDGHRITSAHISSKAYFFDDADRDGPFTFEGEYPSSTEVHPIPTKVHMSWDKEQKHEHVKGEQDGKWRWWTTVPYMESEGGGDEDDDDGATINPGGAAGPKTPSSPTTPGGTSKPAPNVPNVPNAPTTPGAGNGPPTGGGWIPGDTPPPPGGGSGPETPANPGAPPNPPPGGGGLPPRTPNSPTTPNSPITPPTTLGSEYSKFSSRAENRFPDFKTSFPGKGTAYPDTDRELDVYNSRSINKSSRAGVIQKVGGSSAGRDIGLYSIMHPFNTGFAAISFRPQLWIKGAPNFEHNPSLTAKAYKTEERTRPSVLTIRAWGAQNQSGDWDYQSTPNKSRARGGTVKGGILIAPAEFEMEDYLGINSDVDTDNTSVSTFVTFAPTVGAAFGLPTTTGRPSQYSKLIRQNTATGKLAFSEFNASSGVTDIAKMSVLGTQAYMELEGTGAVKIPSGTTGNRPSTGVALGMVRVNTTTSDLEFYDGSAWQNTKMDGDDQDKLDNITVTSATNLDSIRNSVAAIPADTSARLTALEQFQPKAFGRFTTVASPALLGTSYNVASVSRGATGQYAVVIDTDMDTANYTVMLSYEDSSATIQIISASSIATTGFNIGLRNGSNAFSDASESVSFVVFENNS